MCAWCAASASGRPPRSSSRARATRQLRLRRQAVAARELLDQRGAVAGLRPGQRLQVRAQAGSCAMRARSWSQTSSSSDAIGRRARARAAARTARPRCSARPLVHAFGASAASHCAHSAGSRITGPSNAAAAPSSARVVIEPGRLHVQHAITQRRFGRAAGMHVARRDHDQIAGLSQMRCIAHGEGAGAIVDRADRPGVMEMRPIAIGAQVGDEHVAGQAGAAMPDMLGNRHRCRTGSGRVGRGRFLALTRRVSIRIQGSRQQPCVAGCSPPGGWHTATSRRRTGDTPAGYSPSRAGPAASRCARRTASRTRTRRAPSVRARAMSAPASRSSWVPNTGRKPAARACGDSMIAAASR